MKRREFITLLGGAAAAWPLAARAQQAGKMLRVGTVAGTPKSSPQWVAFERRMGELGYQEGKNFSFDFLQAANADEYEILYRKLAARALDVILATGPEIGLKSALAVTRTLPIVVIAIDYDPLARGYITSLARPSGNVTGVVFQQIELAAKRIQLIKDGFPDRPAATMFWDKLSADQWEASRSTAVRLGLQLSGIELHELPYDYEAALDQAPLDHRGILIVSTSPFLFRERDRADRLVTELLKATANTTRELVAKLEAEIAALRFAADHGGDGCALSGHARRTFARPEPYRF